MHPAFGGSRNAQANVAEPQLTTLQHLMPNHSSCSCSKQGPGGCDRLVCLFLGPQLLTCDARVWGLGEAAGRPAGR